MSFSWSVGNGYESKVRQAAAELMGMGYSNYIDMSPYKSDPAYLGDVLAYMNRAQAAGAGWQDALSFLGHSAEEIAQAEAQGYNGQSMFGQGERYLAQIQGADPAAGYMAQSDYSPEEVSYTPGFGTGGGNPSTPFVPVDPGYSNPNTPADPPVDDPFNPPPTDTPPPTDGQGPGDDPFAPDPIDPVDPIGPGGGGDPWEPGGTPGAPTDWNWEVFNPGAPPLDGGGGVDPNDFAFDVYSPGQESPWGHPGQKGGNKDFYRNQFVNLLRGEQNFQNAQRDAAAARQDALENPLESQAADWSWTDLPDPNRVPSAPNIMWNPNSQWDVVDNTNNPFIWDPTSGTMVNNPNYQAGAGGGNGGGGGGLINDA